MRRGIQLQRDQNALTFDGLIKIALAEAEARAGDVDRAVAVIDEAVATCERTEYRAFEAELHRVRGEMLLRDTSDPAPAEEALRSATGVAKQQGTRSFELRATPALAKLYQERGPLPTPTPSSRRRSKASRHRSKCPGSPGRCCCQRVGVGLLLESLPFPDAPLEERNPPNYDVHGRDPQCPVNVDSGRPFALVLARHRAPSLVVPPL